MRTLSRSFQSIAQRTAKKFLRFEHLTAKKFLRFYHAAAKKFLRFPGLKLKRPAISRKKNFFLRTQKEVLARALFLGCTVNGHSPSGGLQDQCKQIVTNITRLRIPSGGRQTSWLFRSVAEKLNLATGNNIS